MPFDAVAGRAIVCALFGFEEEAKHWLFWFDLYWRANVSLVN